MLFGERSKECLEKPAERVVRNSRGAEIVPGKVVGDGQVEERREEQGEG